MSLKMFPGLIMCQSNIPSSVGGRMWRRVGEGVFAWALENQLSKPHVYSLFSCSISESTGPLKGLPPLTPKTESTLAHEDRTKRANEGGTR